MKVFYDLVEELGVRHGTYQSPDGSYRVATKEGKKRNAAEIATDRLEVKASSYSNDIDQS
jgi:hypothetical protein